MPGLTTTPSESRSANFVDINGDGWDDIFITNSADRGAKANNFLYLNNGDGTFTAIINNAIVKDSSRFVAASFADADNDNDLDAFVVSWGRGTINYFYRNDGSGNFTYEADNVSGKTSYLSEAATWIDANNDQKLDLFFTNSAGEAANKYYENKGDGTFQLNSEVGFTDEAFGTRSVDYIDYDNDGDSDLFLTNEYESKNSLFRNDGTNNYTKVTGLSIVEDTKNSVGSSWGDIDNDGDFDLFVANYTREGQPNQLFINNEGQFIEDTSSIIATPISNSFGSTFGDLDNDGDLDLIVCNAYLSLIEQNYIYINDGNGNFSQDTLSVLSNFRGNTFGCALGDYNNDGWLDVVLANNSNQENALYQNTGAGNNWVKINCKATASNRSAIGAKVQVSAIVNGKLVRQTRAITANSGYCSQNSYTLHFGLGDAERIEEIKIYWPAGGMQLFKNVEVNRIHDFIEGQ